MKLDTILYIIESKTRKLFTKKNATEIAIAKEKARILKILTNHTPSV